MGMEQNEQISNDTELALDQLEMSQLIDLMEKMAGAPRVTGGNVEEYEKRQPGERNMYELSNLRNWAERDNRTDQ